MHTAPIVPEHDIDWDNDFIWVQRVAILRVAEAGGEVLRLHRPDGREITLAREEAEAGYYPIAGGGLLKPRYDPVKAHCFKRPATVRLGETTVELKAGDALLRASAGIVTITADDFARDFQAVAYPGHRERPETPFPDLP
jgi:hypothetical protein